MNLSKAASCRIIVICASVICVAGIAGVVIFLMPTFGLIAPESNALWIRYFVTTKTIWLVPIEFYIAIVAIVLLVAQRSIHWSMLLFTVLLGISIGMIHRNPHDVLLWIMILSCVIGLYALNIAFTGTLKTFGRGFIDDMRHIRHGSVPVWKFIAVILAGTLVINYLHGVIIKHTSEEARDERLLKQYRKDKSVSIETGVIRLEIFSDYQCSACSKLVPGYIETASAIGGDTILIEYVITHLIPHATT